MSIVLASGSVMFLAVAFHLSMALVGALLVGAGAGMAFLAGTTLLYGEVGDEVRGRVFAVVKIGTRVVLLLAIALSSALVGLGSSRRVTLGASSIDVSSTRVLLLVAGAGRASGRASARSARWTTSAACRSWPTCGARCAAGRSSPAEQFVRARRLRGLRGRRGRRQVDPGQPARRRAARARAATSWSPASRARPTSGARIRGLVLDKGDAPSPRAEALLYAADRAHHVATVVRPALARGAVVISDRYVDSSLAYQGAGRTLPVQEISWLSSWATGGLKPDLVVLLDVDPGVGLGRVDSRGDGTDRLESESRAFHERVRYAFLDLAAADPKRYLVLDAARPADEIATAVSERLSTILDPLDSLQPEADPDRGAATADAGAQAQPAGVSDASTSRDGSGLTAGGSSD